MKDKKTSVEIAGTVGAFTVAIAAIIVIFAREYSWVIIFTTLILCFFGIVMAKEKNINNTEKPIQKKKKSK
ncbi:MAG: hypothetical protein PHX47_03065 [Candidatus ainarchaeum sp.]|nr:hypothetical protein [Candidatus ainarchaeum sp.]